MNKHLVLKQSVIAVALTLASSQVAVIAQTAPTAPAATVYITGSNLKRTDREGPSPVQTITAKDIKDTGAATVMELMQGVPAMGTDNNLDTADGGFSRGVSTASLRGLTSTSTLILLNGRRIAPGAYADPNDGNSTLYDLNTIPLSAIDRIEILKDGASAVYGSDAVAGVINFITKRDYKGVEVGARYSMNDSSKFVRKGATLLAGMGDLEEDGYNVFFTADVSERERVARRDVTDIEYDTYKVLNGRFATPYGSVISRHPTFYRESAPGSRNFGVTRTTMADRLRPTLSCPESEQLVGSTQMGLPASSVWIGRKFCNYDLNQHLEGTGAGKDANVMSAGRLKLGANATAFAEVAYNRSERNYTGAPITLGQTQVTNFTSSSVGTPFQAILEIGHPDNPFPNARSSVGYRFDNIVGGTAVVNENSRVLVGAEGALGNWSWDTGVLWNESTKTDTYFGRLFLPTLRKLNTGTTLAQLAADPTLARTVNNEGTSSILQWDAKANTEFGKLGGGAMVFGFGGEVRREKLELVPDAVLASGEIYGLSNSIINGQRDVKSAFVELRTPFLKNFEMEFAGRFDKYDGIKTNFVPKVGAKWTVMPTLALRSTYSEGFRAPALNQVTPGGAQFFLNGLFDPKRCEVDEETPKPGATEVDCDKSAAGTGGANPDLVPETSKSLTFGVIFSPTSNFDVLVDFYRIRKEKEVALGSAFDALKNEDKNPGNIVRDTNPANFVRDANGNPIPGTGPLLMVKEPWINQGATQVQGVDFEVRYRKNLGAMGTVSTRLTSTYLDEYLLAEFPGAVENNVAGATAGLWDWQLSSGIDNPRWKTSISAAWNYGVHSVNASMNYIGKVSQLRVVDADVTYPEPFCYYGTRKPTDAVPNRNTTIPLYEAYFPECAINSWTTFGLGYTYTGVKNLTLNMNIRNLLDTKAPYDPSVGTNSGAVLAGYNSGLHNNYGRYFSLSASYKF